MQKVLPTPFQVDHFLRYIDDTYFHGELDLESKDLLRQGLDGEEDKRLVYNCDDESGTSPKMGAKKRTVVFSS